MNELRIQYVTASDGVSIAFADLSDGYPIVYMGGMPFNHIQMQWRLAQYSAWFEQVYMRRRLVMFDARGCGLSDRGVKELSLEAYGRDIDAVADRLQLQKFAIAAVQASVTVAVDYAVRNPDRVSHLYLWDAIPDGRAYSATPETTFRVRIGLNAGEPVREEQDMFGTAVQLARRVCDQASPGTILVTDVVRQLAAGKGYLFSDTGETTLRGFEEPVRLYEVRWSKE